MSTGRLVDLDWGRATAARRPGSSRRPPVVVTVVADRSGGFASVVDRRGSRAPQVLEERPEGWVADVLARALGRPTPPPTDRLSRVVEAALAGRHRPRSSCHQPGARCAPGPALARLHPLAPRWTRPCRRPSWPSGPRRSTSSRAGRGCAASTPTASRRPSPATRPAGGRLPLAPVVRRRLVLPLGSQRTSAARGRSWRRVLDACPRRGRRRPGRHCVSVPAGPAPVTGRCRARWLRCRRARWSRPRACGTPRRPGCGER